MQEECTVAEVDERGRLSLPLPLRKALRIEKGGLVRVTISRIDLEETKSSNENPHEALVTA